MERRYEALFPCERRATFATVTELSDEALVVRGGINRDPHQLLAYIEDNVADGFGPVLSVFANDPEPDEPMEHLLLRVCQEGEVPHGQVQITRARTLRAVALDMIRDTSDEQRPNHYHVKFEEPVSGAQVDAFITCFDGPRPNPRFRKEI